MMFEAESRQRNLKYSETLDRLLGIDLSSRTPKNDEMGLASPHATQQLERPTTRHGRHTIEETSTSTPSNTSEQGKQVDRWQRSSDSETQSSNEDSSEDEFIKRLNSFRRASVKFGIDRTEKKQSTGKVSQVEMEASNIESRNVTQMSELCDNASSISPTRTASISVRPLSSTSSKSSNGSRKSSTKENVKMPTASSCTPPVRKPMVRRKSSAHSFEQQTFRTRSSSTDSGNKKVLKPSSNSKENKITEQQSFRSTLKGLSSNGKSSHERWLHEKRIQEQEKRKQMKEKEEEEKRIHEERKKEAEKSFNSWKEKIDALIIEKKKLEKEKAETLKKEQEEERERKRAESQKMFEAWRKERSRQISANKNMQKRKEEALRKKAEEEAAVKRKDAQKAFQAWCEEKRTKEMETLRRNMESRRTQETQSRSEKEYKDALAKEAYDLWLEMKEQERAQSESLHGRILRFEHKAHNRWPIPWIPPSNTVPRKFTPSGRRKQSTKTTAQHNSALVMRSRSAHR